MSNISKIPPELIDVLKNKFKDKYASMHIPPSAFISMHGELVEYDLDLAFIKFRFPVQNTLLNHFGNMQGGMIAAAIDNALGPLSMLTAPPNFTRSLEIKYNKPISPDLGYIYVTANKVGQDRRKVFFKAEVLDSQGNQMASASAIHWVLSSGQY